jgi:hypothetical protein
VRKAITAGAGDFLIPTLEGYGDALYGYPHSLRGTGTSFTQADINAWFGFPLTIHIGLEDLAELERNNAVNAQGDTRATRTRFFYNFGKAAAEAQGVPFNWRLYEFEGVGHSARPKIIHPDFGAAVLLYGDRPIIQWKIQTDN